MKNKLLLILAFAVLGLTSAYSQLTQDSLVESKCSASGEAHYSFTPASGTGFYN